MVMNQRAPESFSCWTSSPSVLSGFSVVLQPPAMAIAWKAVAYSGRLGLQIATTPPRSSPRAARPRAAAAA